LEIGGSERGDHTFVLRSDNGNGTIEGGILGFPLLSYLVDDDLAGLGIFQWKGENPAGSDRSPTLSGCERITPLKRNVLGAGSESHPNH